jgi:hypothetical protein
MRYSGGNILMDNGGRVGIGTSSPNSASPLHIRMCSNSNGDGIRIQAICSGGPGSQPGIAFANVSDAKRWAISLDNTSDIIQITNATGANTLQINQSGVACFVGTVCTPTLSVNSGVLAYGSAGGLGCIYITTATGTNEQDAIILDKAGGFGTSSIRNYYTNVPNYGIAFRAGLVTGMYIQCQGNVGIGTSTPADRLQVLGSLRWGGSSVNVASSNDASGVYLEVNGTSTATRRLRLQGINDAGNRYTQFFINAGAGEMCFVTEDVQRLLIESNGVANFSNIVCANTFSTQGSIRVNGVMKTFAISKNFGERQTNVDYFRMSAGATSAYQVMVYSVSQNVGVGWNQSQLFQASTAPYWGGWIGTSGAISTLGSGAGFISSAVIGNDGTITFRVTTGDNGTSTTGTILSYIQVTAFNIDNVGITAL